MINISKLSEQEKVLLVENRWNDSSSVFEIVAKTYAKNRSYWENNPDWIKQVPIKRSKARSNRIFLAAESVLSNLLGRPSKPNVIPAKQTDESAQLAEDLQDYFLDKYRTLGIKDKMRRGLRHLLFSRFFCLKVVWDKETDDFNVIVPDPRNVRVSKKANSMYDTEFVIEEIPDKPVIDLIELFPSKKEEILKRLGIKEKDAIINNETVRYKEAWFGDEVVYIMNDLFLYSELHPYWDWDGLLFTDNELMKFEETAGTDKRIMALRSEKLGENRKRNKKQYENWLYNHFDKPLPPYIFGSIFKTKDSPVGDTSLIEQVIPLQEEIDKRKRQISDNAETMNGIVKVDTRVTSITAAQAQMMKSDPRGLWYGEGVRDGITVEPGKDLPVTIKDDLVHSTNELDAIFGTQSTFRGERGAQETATGRAILRDQSFQRLDELVDFIDNIHAQLYGWWFQMMKVRYTESHYAKALGDEAAMRTIEFMRNDLLDGVEIRVVPGQIMPEDRLFRAERAKEEMVAGIIDPLTYFEETHRDNPEKLAKRLLMFKTNPFAVIKLDPEDLQAIQEAMALMAQLQPPQPQQGGGQNEKAGEIAQVRQKAEELMQSEQFQRLPEEQKREAMIQIQEQLSAVTSAK